ncbi:ATP-binding protein [Propionivibrio dicarboxylicus]|nr:ATP-binding protein [Propionivibrio dicarboxylicus]
MEFKTKVAYCEIHGEYDSRCRLINYWTPCPQCQAVATEKRNEEQRISDERQKQERVRKLICNSELPTRFTDRTLDSFVADTPQKKRALSLASEYAEQFDDVLQTGRCALFIGRPGTGKTHLAAGIGLHLMNNGYSVRYTTVNRLIRRIRSTWSRASEETEQQAIAAFSRPALLILDEVGVQYGSEAEKISLFDVINERYENRMPTLLISNLDRNGVAEALGERVFDRLREDAGRVVAFDWESARHTTVMKAALDETNPKTSTTQQNAGSGVPCTAIAGD